MAIDSCAYWLAKCGNSPEEYEDAFAEDTDRARFAVADGASESGFARLWARLLVEQFVADADDAPGLWAASLAEAQQRWWAEVGGRDLPWYAEAKREQGAFATFLGLTLTSSRWGGYRWHAVAVGDSCLFHTRGTRLVRAFPLRHSEAFGNSPWLIGSRTPPEKVVKKCAERRRGGARPGDRLWMMTDALAQWFLNEHETGKMPWQELESLFAEPDVADRFAGWIDGLRGAKQLRNDDVTLLAVRLSAGEAICRGKDHALAADPTV